jgi:hypothetical protein
MHNYSQHYPYKTKKKSNTHDSPPNYLNMDDIVRNLLTDNTIKTFPRMLKLIRGTLVGSVKYSDLYIDSDGKDISSTNGYVTSNDTGHDKNNILQKMPTLPQIA